MSADPRLERSTEHLVHALDAHLFTLRSHLSKLREGPSHLKVISAELRVLVCKSSGVEGLLWRLVETLGVDDGVSLILPGKFNTAHPLMKKLTLMIAPASRGHLPHPHFQPGFFSLKKVIKETDALIANGRPLTHEKLISAAAQQLGLAHEADKVDPALVQLSSIFINGTDSIAVVLALDAALVLEVGERVLIEAERKLELVRAQHEHDYGNLTIFLGFRVRKLPHERMRVFNLRSFVSSVSIDYLLTSTGGQIEIRHREKLLFQNASRFDVPKEGDWSYAEALSYCSRTQQIRTFIDEENGPSEKAVANCALGWVHAADFEIEIVPPNEFVEAARLFSFSRLLSSKEIDQIATEPNSGGIFISEEELTRRGAFPD